MENKSKQELRDYNDSQQTKDDDQQRFTKDGLPVQRGSGLSRQRSHPPQLDEENSHQDITYEDRLPSEYAEIERLPEEKRAIAFANAVFDPKNTAPQLAEFWKLPKPKSYL